MSDQEMLSFRVDVEIIERLTVMADVLQSVDEFSWGGVTRSSVARLALLRGLVALEKKHPPKKKRR